MKNGIQCALMGHVRGEPAALRFTRTGVPFVNFPVIVEDTKRQADEDPEWVRVTAWGELAERLDGVLHKGDTVYAEGRLRLWHGSSADGAPIARLSLSAQKVEPIGFIGRRMRWSAPASPASEPEPVDVAAVQQLADVDAAKGAGDSSLARA